MNLVDPQLAGSLAEHVVDCKRTDRLTIPIIGPILNAVGFAQLLPKIHVAKVYYGNKNPIAVGRWWYRGLDLYDCYDTAQIFSEQIEIDLKTGELTDGRKTFTPLPPYHSNRLPLLQSLEKEVKTIRDDIAQRTAKQRKARTMTPGLCMVAGVCAGLIVWTLKGMAEDYQVLSHRLDPVPSQTEPEKPPVSTTFTTFTTSETVVGPGKTDPLIALLESATVLRPVTYTENGQVQGILKIVKESAEYRLSYAEIRAQGWIVVDGPNSIMLVRSDTTIQLPIAAKYVPVHEVPPGGVASGLGRP